jgi:hypothetical protein
LWREKLLVVLNNREGVGIVTETGFVEGREVESGEGELGFPRSLGLLIQLRKHLVLFYAAGGEGGSGW